MNPVTEFIKEIQKVDEKSETFYADCFNAINNPKTIGAKYEGGKLDTYLNDIQGHDYPPEQVKEYLIELVQRVDRTTNEEA